MEFFTIGVYNSSEEEYFNKLTTHNIDTFCDIRQRRAVRGSKYAFVNSKRLQSKISELGIKYTHFLDLAPTKDIREKQKKADEKIGEQKRTRNKLGEVFTKEYNEKILSNFNFDDFIKKLELIGAKRIVLFCVEEKHEACHRHLVSNILEKKYNYQTTHL